MSIQVLIFLFLILNVSNCDLPTIQSGYFHILYEHNFEQANLCLPLLNLVSVSNMNECLIACLKNKYCRTATFDQITNQCQQFYERLEDGQIKPQNSIIVISLTERQLSDEKTNQPIPTQITSPNDTIIGIWNTSAGQDSTPIQVSHYCTGGSPPNQDVSKAIDNDISTKHVSYGDGCNTHKSYKAGHNTGFFIIPTRLSILTRICWVTSKEINETARDPLSITIEGSNKTLPSDLIHGSSWSLIYSGTSGLDNNSPRSSYKLLNIFPLYEIRSNPFRSYRLLIVQKCGLEDSVQYSEAQLVGYIIN